MFANATGLGGRIGALGIVQRSMRFALWVLAAAIVADGLLGPQRPSALNLAGVLPWTYFRPVAVLGLVVAGNLFCGVCPIISTRKLAGRLLGHRLRWPRALRGRWVAAALFALYLWGYEIFALWDSPWWTAWVIVGYFGVAFVVEGAFARGTFCRHVCPIGQLQFVGSLIAPRSLQAVDSSVCASCSTRDCVAGNSAQPGCPTGLAIPSKAGGLDCTLCLDCVRACPHDNVGWLAVPRSRALGVGRTAGSLPGPDTTWMIGLFVFGAFVNAAAMVAPVEALRRRIVDPLGESLSAVVWALALALALTALPAVVTTLAGRVGPRRHAGSIGWRERSARMLPALVPLGVAMWAAHFLKHWLAGPLGAAPALGRALDAVWAGAGAWLDRVGDVSSGVAFAPEPWLLGVGLVASVSVVWRSARDEEADRADALRAALPWLVVAVLLHLSGVWILSSPMAMRGMLM